MTADREKLLLDVMLGGLRSYLRMCNYDTVYALDEDIEADDALMTYADEHERTLVTRDRELAQRCDPAILVTEREVTDQLAELDDVGLLLSLADEPQYCGRCNGILETVSSDSTVPEYAPERDEQTLWCCTDCGQYFWKGSHWESIKETLQTVL